MATIEEVQAVVDQILALLINYSDFGTWGTPTDYSLLVRQDQPAGSGSNQAKVEDLPMVIQSTIGRAASGDIVNIALAEDEVLGRATGGNVAAVPFATIEKAGPIFNVMNYGAAGDGSTDDAASIQLAIDAANTAGGGTVYFPANTYTIETILTVGSNTTIHLDGATLKRNHIDVDVLIYNKTVAAAGYAGDSKIAIVGTGTIDMNGTNFVPAPTASYCTGIAFGHCSQVLIRGITFIDGHTNHCIEICGCEYATIENCTFRDGNDVDDEEEMIQFDFMGSTLQFPFGSPTIDDTACLHCRVIDCNFKNGATGIGNHTGKVGVYQDDILIDGCIFDTITHECISFIDARDLTITNCQFKTADHGIWNTATPTNVLENYTINDNYFEDINTGSGVSRAIRIRGESVANRSKKIIVKGNHVIDTGRHAIGVDHWEDVVVSDNVVNTAEYVGIYIWKCLRGVVSGNVVENCGTTGGVSITIGADAGSVTDTTDIVVIGNVTDDLWVDDQCTRTVVANNILTGGSLTDEGTATIEINNYVNGTWTSKSISYLPSDTPVAGDLVPFSDGSVLDNQCTITTLAALLGTISALDDLYVRVDGSNPLTTTPFSWIAGANTTDIEIWVPRITLNIDVLDPDQYFFRMIEGSVTWFFAGTVSGENRINVGDFDLGTVLITFFSEHMFFGCTKSWTGELKTNSTEGNTFNFRNDPIANGFEPDLPALLNASGGTQVYFAIKPTYDQTSTAGWTALEIDVTDLGSQSGTTLLLDLQIGSVSQFSVTQAGAMNAGDIFVNDITSADITAENLTIENIAFTGTPYRLIYIDGSGGSQELAHGAVTRVLTSNGANANPSWEVAAGGTGDEVTATANIADNALVRGHGGAKVIQQSELGAVTLDDSNNIDGVAQLTLTGNIITSGLVDTVDVAAEAASSIHDDVASEISAITVKGTPVAGDFFLIEDSAAANVKKHVLMSGIDHDVLANYDGDRHTLHTAVTLTAGAGLAAAGTGDITASRTFDVVATTNGGIVVNSDDVELDLTNLVAQSTMDTGDLLVFHDITATAHHNKITLGEFLAQIAGANITSTGTALDGSAGGSLDINGLTEDAAITSGDFLPYYDTTEAANNKIDWNDIIAKIAGNGLVVNSDVVDLDIDGLTGNATIEATDTMAYYDGANKKITFAQLEAKLDLDNILNRAKLATRGAVFYIENPVTAKSYPLCMIPKAATITFARYETDAGTVVFNIEARADATPLSAGTDLWLSDETASSTTETNTSFTGTDSGAITARDTLWFAISSVTGTPTKAILTLEWTVD